MDRAQSSMEMPVEKDTHVSRGAIVQSFLSKDAMVWETILQYFSTGIIHELGANAGNVVARLKHYR